MELRGTKGLLTGAAGGLGSEMARRLAREGVTLALSGRNVGGLETLRDELPGEGHAVVPGDLASSEDVAALVTNAEAAVGPIDLLVNNAGIELTSNFADLTAAELEQMIQVNLTAPMLLTHRVLPGMLERRRGHVVQISSVAGLVSPAYTAPYGATKGGLVRLTESLRMEHAGSGVGFSAVCPGFTRGAGMYQRMVDEGLSAPKVLGTTTDTTVAEGVVSAVVKNRAVVVCNSLPLQPLLAVGALSPGLLAWMTERLGGNAAMRKAAEANRNPH